jgi:hypothetical protein
MAGNLGGTLVSLVVAPGSERRYDVTGKRLKVLRRL